MNKNLLARIALAVALFSGVILSGCNKSAAPAVSSDSPLFSSGPMKDEWAMVVAAMHTNGYFVAVTTLDKMRAENPSQEQLAAINGTARSLSQQMMDRAAKGDADARNALAQLRSSQAPKR